MLWSAESLLVTDWFDPSLARVGVASSRRPRGAVASCVVVFALEEPPVSCRGLPTSARRFRRRVLRGVRRRCRSRLAALPTNCARQAQVTPDLCDAGLHCIQAVIKAVHPSGQAVVKAVDPRVDVADPRVDVADPRVDVVDPRVEVREGGDGPT